MQIKFYRVFELDGHRRIDIGRFNFRIFFSKLEGGMEKMLRNTLNERGENLKSVT